MHKPHTHRPKFVMRPNTAFVAGFTNLADYFWLLVGSPWSPGLEFIMVIRQQTAFWQSRRFRREDCSWLVGWLVGSELCCRWMQKKKNPFCWFLHMQAYQRPAEREARSAVHTSVCRQCEECAMQWRLSASRMEVFPSVEQPPERVSFLHWWVDCVRL